MIKLERSVSLHLTTDKSTFEHMNREAFISDSRPLGNSVSAVNKMVSCGEEMTFLLPSIIGLSPTSNEWAAKVENYWHNFGIDVPLVGKTMNTTLIFDVTDYVRKGHIAELATTLKLKSDAEDYEKKLFNYIIKNVPESGRYRYMAPEAVEDYLLWRFCLVYSRVGNSVTDITRKDNKGNPMFVSNKIVFYLKSSSEIAKEKKELQEVRNLAMQYYNELLKDSKLIDTLIFVNDKLSTIKAFKEMTDTDKQAELFQIATTDYKRLVRLYETKDRDLVAKINKFKLAGLIKNLDNTSIYVETDNPSKVWGNSVDEVISFMSNDTNKAYINEIELKVDKLFN